MKTLYTFLIYLFLFSLNISYGNNCFDATQTLAGTNSSDLSQENELWYKYTSTRDGIIKIYFTTDISRSIWIGPIHTDSCNSRFLSDKYFSKDNSSLSIITRKNQTYYWRFFKLNLEGAIEQHNWTLSEVDPEVINESSFTVQTNLTYKIYKYKAKKDGFLVVKAAGNINVEGNYYIDIVDFNKTSFLYIDKTYKEDTVYLNCKKDSIYYLKFQNNLDEKVSDDNVISVVIQEQLIPKESTCEKALTAKKGVNTTTFNQLREIWYKYTSLSDTILHISISSQIPFNIGNFKINSCGNSLLLDYSVSYYSKDISKSNILIYAQKDKTYFWQFLMDEKQTPIGSYNWNLTEEALEYGWSLPTAQSIQEDTFEVPGNLKYPIYYKYKAKRDGILSLRASDAPEGVIEFYFSIIHKNLWASNSLWSSTDENIANLECKKDSVYYLFFNTIVHENNPIGGATIILREASVEGSKCHLAIETQKETTITTTLDPFAERWYKYKATTDGLIKIKLLSEVVQGIYFTDYIYVGSCDSILDGEYVYDALTFEVRKGETYLWNFHVDYWKSIYKPFDWKITEEEKPNNIDSESNAIVSVYPNPVEDHLSIKINGSIESVIIKILTINGQEVITRKLSNTSGTIMLNTADLHQGNYILIVESDNSSETFKILKK